MENGKLISSEANIADKLNPGNGIALILYGLTIGKTPQAGTLFIKKGLENYPFVSEPNFLGWQPYHVLVRYLEPWLVTSDSEKFANYEKLMFSGKDLFKDQRWEEARRFFEDASLIKPDLPEPDLYLIKWQFSNNSFSTNGNGH